MGGPASTAPLGGNKVPPVPEALQSVLEAIGSTPVVRLARVVPDGVAGIYLKLEIHNPGGSAKDRVAVSWIEREESKGRLKTGAHVVAASTGSLGISLAMVCAARGYSLTVVMPDAMALEKRATLKLYGAKVVLTPAEEGFAGATSRAREIAASSSAALLDQLAGEEGVEAHAGRTGPELVEAARSEGGLDGFVCGVGTGALLAGISRSIREHFPRAVICAVEPAGSARMHRLQGLGLEAARRTDVDRVFPVADAEAWAMKERLGREEGLLVGISTGAHVLAAVRLGRELGAERRVYTLAVDTGERYFSMAQQFT
jgi:cysteine synthase A